MIEGRFISKNGRLSGGNLSERKIFRIRVWRFHVELWWIEGWFPPDLTRPSCDGSTKPSSSSTVTE